MKYASKSALGRRIEILKAQKFLSEKLRSSTCFFSYDLTALGFSVMTFLHGDIDIMAQDG